MSNKSKTICRHYVNNNCKNGKLCRYEHVDNLCRDYFNGNCTRTNCKFLHIINHSPNSKKDISVTNDTYTNLDKNSKSDTNSKPDANSKDKSAHTKNRNNRSSPYGIKKNTETFEPWYNPADIHILVKNAELKDCLIPYNTQIASRDVILISNLFADMSDVYNKIITEIEKVKNEKIWVEWHGGTHLIANDHEKWKDHSITFTKIIDRISKYFNMDVKATRLNWYSSSDYKSFHHDAAAIDANKAKTQNFTVGVSFGETRSVEFQHAKTRTTVNITLENGSTYAFSKDVNIQWRHGIPPLPKDAQSNNEGRISIIAWGWVNQLDV
jgi:hypothetical protein